MARRAVVAETPAEKPTRRRRTTPAPTPTVQEASVTDLAPRREGRKGGPKALTAEHLGALAVGRVEGKVVSRYLEVLEQSRPKRGRKPSLEGLQQRLAAVDDHLAQGPTGLKKVTLLQQRLDLQTKILRHSVEEGVIDIAQEEKAFIEVARSVSERKGISRAAWRQAGVPARVLREAGIYA